LHHLWNAPASTSSCLAGGPDSPSCQHSHQRVSSAVALVLTIRHVGDELREPIGIAVQLRGQARVGLPGVTCPCLDEIVSLMTGLVSVSASTPPMRRFMSSPSGRNSMARNAAFGLSKGTQGEHRRRCRIASGNRVQQVCSELGFSQRGRFFRGSLLHRSNFFIRMKEFRM
jgi:hypothetical protein